MDSNDLIKQLSAQCEARTEVEKILALWFEVSNFITGEVEEKNPALRRARVLTGDYFNRVGWPEKEIQD